MDRSKGLWSHEIEAAIQARKVSCRKLGKLGAAMQVFKVDYANGWNRKVQEDM